MCVLASSPRRRLGEGQGGVQALGAEAFLEALGGSLSLRGLLPGKVSGRQGSPGWAPSPIWGQQQGASATGSLPRKSQAQLLRKGPSTGERGPPSFRERSRHTSIRRSHRETSHSPPSGSCTYRHRAQALGKNTLDGPQTPPNSACCPDVFKWMRGNQKTADFGLAAKLRWLGHRPGYAKAAGSIASLVRAPTTATDKRVTMRSSKCVCVSSNFF